MNEKKWKLKKKNTSTKREKKHTKRPYVENWQLSVLGSENSFITFEFCRSFPPWKNGTQKSV